MERRAQFVLVAVFLLLSVGSVVWFMRWIAPSDGGLVDQRLVQFDSSVSGLSVGSVVLDFLYMALHILKITFNAIARSDPVVYVGKYRVEAFCLLKHCNGLIDIAEVD